VTGGLRGVRRWSDSELEADARTAAAEFRRRRMAEPLPRYLGAFDDARPAVAAWVEVLDDVLGPEPPQRLAEGLSSETGRIAFRYLGAPPISQDDLETLAERRFASAAGALGDDQAAPLREVMRAIADPRRFPWLAEERAATPCELDAGVLATTALMASQKVQTLRRSDEKAAVEGAVRGLLVGLGWQQAQPRSARAWLAAFGAEQVIPAVALQGVFNPRYVAEAQGTPLAVFWSHRLDDLRDFLSGRG
jgi:hypothetical protein